MNATRYSPVALRIDANVGDVVKPLSWYVKHLASLEQNFGYQSLARRLRMQNVELKTKNDCRVNLLALKE